jgi:peroxiredoxin
VVPGAWRVGDRPTATTTIAPMIEPGTHVPGFKLASQDGEPVKLSDLRGNTVVLHLDPKADTRVADW